MKKLVYTLFFVLISVVANGQKFRARVMKTVL